MDCTGASNIVPKLLLTPRSNAVLTGKSRNGCFLRMPMLSRAFAATSLHKLDRFQQRRASVQLSYTTKRSSEHQVGLMTLRSIRRDSFSTAMDIRLRLPLLQIA